MQYRALATDYDGTLAHDGVVPPETVDALVRLKSAGLLLLMVTGRRLDDLEQAFPFLVLFDVVVGENGAVLHWPRSGQEEVLASPPPPAFASALRALGVDPLYVGRVVVATEEQHALRVRSTTDRLGLPLHVELNKGSLMVLPAGVTKASGLVAALDRLGLGAAETVGIGDAENDVPFLRVCGLAVAVANALPSVKAEADLVTDGSRGNGVVELVDCMLQGELHDLGTRANRHTG